MAFGDVQFVSRKGLLSFSNPVDVVCVRAVDGVAEALRRVGRGVDAGLHAAGFLAYEAAPAFDPAFAAHPPGPLPLLWFGLYDAPLPGDLQDCGDDAGAPPCWEALVSGEEFAAAMARIRGYIAAGDTYQVNLTFPLRADFKGGARAWFRRLCAAQRADYCAFIDAGTFQILSASPELFFRLDGRRIETRPMKGTRPRGLWPEADRRAARELAESEKDRAENLMIVDLLRNDLGRVAETGTVRVERLFELERYETVWQMTSTIAAETAATVPEIFRALFPCGSVTGAPKVRTMRIINGLEPHPRGVYCGAAGWWSPGRRAEFNVAIRTVTLDAERGAALYSVGAGITWDSRTEAEHAECMAKAAVLNLNRPPFDLLESLLWEGGYFLLDGHLRRLSESADYFGFVFDAEKVKRFLLDEAVVLAERGVGWKVRLLLARDGACRVESEPAGGGVPVRLGFAADPVDAEGDVFLYHKTTHREAYRRALASRPDCGEVLLWNRRGEVTEASTANVVAEIGGVRWTPPVSCGLLAGTMRESLLEKGEIRERILTKGEIVRAERVWLVNSVRGWVQAAGGVV